MKKILLTIFSGLISLFIVGQNNYQNNLYRYKVKVPKNWKVYGEIKHDSIKRYSIINWDLPKIYSEIENAMIENQISVTAYRKTEFKNVFDLIQFEFNKKKKFLKSKTLIDSIPLRTYIVNSDVNGAKYKSKLYFIYINGIGYVINYTATPGTFNKNIKEFEKFFNSMNFL